MSPRMTSSSSITSMITWKSVSPATLACCGAGSRRLSGDGVGEAQAGTLDVIGIDFNADPAALQGFGHLPGDVAAGEGVNDLLARLGQEADKELRDLGGKTGRVNRYAGRPATAN